MPNNEALNGVLYATYNLLFSTSSIHLLALAFTSSMSGCLTAMVILISFPLNKYFVTVFITS